MKENEHHHKTINFDVGKAARFKVEYDRAIKEKKVFFIFEGNDYNVGYAKYLIQYLQINHLL